jgi:hypothetical protein
MFVGIAILAISANLFLANNPPWFDFNVTYFPFSSVYIAEVNAVNEP